MRRRREYPGRPLALPLAVPIWRFPGDDGSGGGAATPFAGAYDAIASLVHIYEPARRTLTAYTGDLALWRRASDNAEMAFAYDAAGNLDAAALATWLGGSAGYFVTVYDQAAAGDDITQAVAAAQPLYIASGQNGRPGLSISAGGLQGAYTAGGALTQPFMYFIGATLGSGLSNNDVVYYLAQGDGGTGQRARIGKVDATPDAWELAAPTVLKGGIANENANLFAVLFNAGSSQLWINNSSIVSGSAGAETPDGFTLGNNWTLEGNYWVGTIDFALILDADATQRAAIQTIINDFWSYY